MNKKSLSERDICTKFITPSEELMIFAQRKLSQHIIMHERNAC